MPIIADPRPVAGAVPYAGWQCSRLTQPDGHHIRIAAWKEMPSGRPRGTVLLLTGRSETLEKYGEQAADWTARGFHTVGMDWRGQGGSSRYLDNRHKGHVPDFRIFMDDLDRAIVELLPTGTPQPVIGFAHSMGGHVLLRHVAERAHPFAGVILSAPMLGIRTAPLPEPVARRLAAWMVARGKGGDYALRQTDWIAAEPTFEKNPLTSDPVRFLIGHNCYAADPALAMGGATWGWLDAAFRSMAELFAPGKLEKVEVPVLMMTARADRIVRVDRHERAIRHLKHGRRTIYPLARHELMMETDSIRNAVWMDIDAFLAELTVQAGT
ncbi:alpha/beta fold hydrolase [Indioceanicola profundi]|uniref:alpha/beta fold hydrolase n=1 Tax=Indioceanicola profundi TaxID=2220096 RepID=UPI0013C51DFC|nr:alpha/beta hydrolase [Indioceanicola profundi]